MGGPSRVMPMRPRNSLGPGNRACSPAGNTPHPYPGVHHHAHHTGPQTIGGSTVPYPKGKVTDYGAGPVRLSL